MQNEQCVGNIEIYKVISWGGWDSVESVIFTFPNIELGWFGVA